MPALLSSGRKQRASADSLTFPQSENAQCAFLFSPDWGRSHPFVL